MAEPVDSIAASSLASAAILASLVQILVDKGLLSESEVREVYEQALLMMETESGESPTAASIFETARELIEEHLRPSNRTSPAE